LTALLFRQSFYIYFSDHFPALLPNLGLPTWFFPLESIVQLSGVKIIDRRPLWVAIHLRPKAGIYGMSHSRCNPWCPI